MALTHREEKILEAVIDGSSVPFDPITRREKIFAKAAGEDIELAPPITKEEQILSALAAKGSGGGGSSDFSTAKVTFVKNTVSATIQLPHLIENNLTLSAEADEDTYLVPIPNNGSTTGIIVASTDYSSVTGSGSVEIQQIPDSPTFFAAITGNCTITLNA